MSAPDSPLSDNSTANAVECDACSPTANVQVPSDCEHPCPFCGSVNLEETLWRGKLMIACNDCQSTGPWASSWQEAMEGDRPRRRAWELWNRRAIHTENTKIADR